MGKAPKWQWSCWGGGGLAIMDQHLLAPAFLMSLPHHLLLTQREQPQQCRAQACSRVCALACTTQRPQLPVSLCSFQTEQALGLERKRAQTRVKETGGQSLNCLPSQCSWEATALNKSSFAPSLPSLLSPPAFPMPLPTVSTLWSGTLVKGNTHQAAPAGEELPRPFHSLS